MSETYPRQALLLDYVRTFAIVIGIIVALSELDDALAQSHRESFEATAAMMARFGDEDMAEAAHALASFQHLPDTDQAYDKLLQDLTPIRQHLIVWAACIDEGICLTGASRSIFCQRALAYETSFQSVQTKFGRKYDGSTRHSQLFGQHEKCLSDRPDSPPQ